MDLLCVTKLRHWSNIIIQYVHISDATNYSYRNMHIHAWQKRHLLSQCDVSFHPTLRPTHDISLLLTCVSVTQNVSWGRLWVSLIISRGVITGAATGYLSRNYISSLQGNLVTQSNFLWYETSYDVNWNEGQQIALCC